MEAGGARDFRLCPAAAVRRGRLSRGMEAVALVGPSCGTMSFVPTRIPERENDMSGWAWMAIGATVLAVVIMQIAMRIK